MKALTASRVSKTCNLQHRCNSKHLLVGFWSHHSCHRPQLFQSPQYCFWIVTRIPELSATCRRTLGKESYCPRRLYLGHIFSWLLTILDMLYEKIKIVAFQSIFAFRRSGRFKMLGLIFCNQRYYQSYVRRRCWWMAPAFGWQLVQSWSKAVFCNTSAMC